MNLNRISKFALLLALAFCAPMKALAAGEAMFSKGHSTWTVAGVSCTASATDITATVAGFSISAYRLLNTETTIAVYIGHDSLVSNDTSNARAGERLAAGASGVWEIGKNPDLAQAAVKIWCRAASGTARLSRAVFSYK